MNRIRQVVILCSLLLVTSFVVASEVIVNFDADKLKLRVDVSEQSYEKTLMLVAKKMNYGLFVSETLDLSGTTSFGMSGSASAVIRLS